MNRNRFVVSALSLGLLTVYAVLPSSAGAGDAVQNSQAVNKATTGAPATEDRYAAIAYSPSMRRWGTSWNHTDLNDAKFAALRQCPYGDARIVHWARNAYAALAIGRGTGWGAAWSSDPDEARRLALENARRYTTGCYVAVIVKAKS